MGVLSRFGRVTTEGKCVRKAQNGTNEVVLCNFFGFFPRFFASSGSFLSTPNFQKSTPFENLALTFSSEKAPKFGKIALNRLVFSCLANLLKIGVFFSQKFSRAKFSRIFEG